MQSPSFRRRLVLERFEDRIVCDASRLPGAKPPIAVDDDTIYQILLPSTSVVVLGNDSDPNPGGTLDFSTVTVVTPPQFGQLQLDPGNGTFLYTPNYNLPPGLPPGAPPPEPQQDAFTYHVKNNLGLQSNTANVILRPVGAPIIGDVVAGPDIAVTRSVTPVVIDLTTNDVVLDGGEIDFASVGFDTEFSSDPFPRNGTVSFDPSNGKATYTPNFGYIGWDKFQYKVSSTAGGIGGNHVYVIINPDVPRLQPDPQGGTMLIVDGSNAADAITVIPGEERGTVRVIRNGEVSAAFRPTSRIVVFGYGGDDSIIVSPSVTTPVWLLGGFGNDTLIAGGGSALMLGGDGDDNLIGGAGRDLMIGGRGSDVAIGRDGDDILVGGSVLFDVSEELLAQRFNLWQGRYRNRCHRRFPQPSDIVSDIERIDDVQKDVLEGGPSRINIFAEALDEVVLTRPLRRGRGR